MPATVTHAIFTKDVYDILTPEIKRYLNIDRFKMFGQSMDACFFYNILSLFPGKKIRKFASYFHNNKTQELFLNIVNYMKDNNISDNDSYSFLFGFYGNIY